MHIGYCFAMLRLAPILAVALASAAPATVDDVPLGRYALRARPQLLCQGDTCIRIPAAELCQRYLAAAEIDRTALRLTRDEKGRRALGRLIASIR